MALDVNKLMASRYPHLAKKQGGGSDEQMLKDTYAAFKEYGSEIHKHFGQLIKFVEKSEQTDDFLIDAMDTLRDLIKHMQTVDKGGTVTGPQTRQFFEMFHDITEQLEKFTKQKPDHPYSDQVKEKKRDFEEAKKSRIAANEDLSKRMGRSFEDVMVDQASTVGKVQGNIFKVGLASFLGPAAPLVNVVDKLFDVDSSLAGMTKKMFSSKKDASDKSESRDQLETEEAHYEQERRDRASDVTWQDKMLGALGLISGKKVTTSTSPTSGAPGVGGWANKLGSLGGGALSKVAAGAGIAGGAYGLYDSASDLAGSKYKNEDGSKKGFTEGGLNSRAGSYGQAALSGAAMGAGIGSIIPGVGTAVGGAVGAAVGAGAAVIADYHEEIKGFLDDTGATKLFEDGVKGLGNAVTGVGDWMLDAGKSAKGFMDDTGLTKLAGDTFTLWLNGWKNIGGWIADGAKALADSGILQFIGGAYKKVFTGWVTGIRTIAGWVGDVAGFISDSGVLQALGSGTKTVIKGAVDGIYSIAGFLSDIPDNLSKASDYAIKAFSDMGAKISKWYADVKKEVQDFMDDPIGYIKKKAAAAASAALSGAGNAVTAVGSAVAKGADAAGSAIKSGGTAVAEAVKPYSATASSVIGKGADIAGSVVSGAGKAYGKAAAWTGSALGSLSAKFESGNKGSSAVGFDSTGGASYGTYQIATKGKSNTMPAFLAYLAKAKPEWYARLSKAGDYADPKGGFAQEWKKIASEDSKGFNDVQHDFIKSSMYDPAVKSISKATGLDIDSKSKVLQDVLWSTAVQHGTGGAVSIFSQAIKSAGGPDADDKDIIKAVYNARSGKFGSSTAAVRGSVQKRFGTEQDMALSALSTEGASGAAPAGAAPASAEVSSPVGPSPQKVDTVASVAPATGTSVGQVATASSYQSSAASATPAPVSYERVSPLPPVPEQAAEPATQVAQSSPSRSSGTSVSVDSVPSTITDEGLLILNMANLS